MLTHTYTKKICNKKILIIGPYPPPLGGVAVHVKRVIQKLQKQNNDVTIVSTTTRYNNSKLVPLSILYALLKKRPDIVMLHEPTMSRLRFLSTVMYKKLFRYRLMTIDHNCRLLYTYTPRNKRFFSYLMKQVDIMVVMGDTTHQCYIDNTVTQAKNYSIESPFLPPNLREEKDILWQYPVAVHKFISTHAPLLTANASAPTLTNNKDLYGIVQCIKLIAHLKKEYKNIGLLFGMGSLEKKEYKEYFLQLKTMIAKENLDDAIHFYVGKQEFWPLIKQSNLFLRPTLSDGHSLSIKEAEWLKIPTVASNCCLRPKDTILFETKNEVDFIEIVSQTLKGIDDEHIHDHSLRGKRHTPVAPE